MSMFLQCSVCHQSPSDFELRQGNQTKHFGYCHFLAHLMVKPNTLDIPIDGDKLQKLNTLSEISLSLQKLKQKTENDIKHLRSTKNRFFEALESIFDHEYTQYYSLAKQLSDKLLLIQEHSSDPSYHLDDMIDKYYHSGISGILTEDLYDVNDRSILDAFINLLGIDSYTMPSSNRFHTEPNTYDNSSNPIQRALTLPKSPESEGSLQLIRKYTLQLQDLKSRRSSLSPNFIRYSQSPTSKPEPKLKRMQILNPNSLKLSKPNLPDLPITSNLVTLTGHSENVTCLCASSDNKYLISGSLDKTVKLWNTDSKNIMKEFESSSCVYSCILTKENSIAWIGCGDGTVRMINTEHMREVDILTGHAGRVFSLCMSKNGRYLVSGSGDGTVIVWNATTLRIHKQMQGHSSVVYCVAITHNSKHVVSGSGNGMLIVWKLSDGALESVLEGHSKRVSCIDISKDSEYIISSSYDNTIKIWNLTAKLLEITISTQKVRIDYLKFTPDCKHLIASSSCGSISLYSLSTSLAVNSMRLCDTRINSICISKDYNCIILGCNDAIKIWTNFNLF